MNRAALVLCVLAACARHEPAPATAAPAAPPASVVGRVQADAVHFSYAVFFLPAPTSDPERALTARCHAAPADQAFLASKRDAAASFRDTSDELLDIAGVDLTIADKKALRRSDPPWVLTVKTTAPLAARALHRADVLAGCVAQATGGVVYDYSTKQLFSADAWQQRRVASWHGDVPDAAAHFVIHEFPDGALLSEDTLGLDKLGLPDLEVENIPRNAADAMARIINMTADALAKNPTVPAAGVSLNGVNASLVWRRATATRTDNRLLAFRFATTGAGSTQEQQMALLTRIVGSEPDPIVRVEHDAELLAASARARKRLGALQPTFARGLGPRDQLLVKAPFATNAGGTEWMWVEVASWDGDSIGGILDNDPDDVPNLKSGSHVTVAQSRVFDYIYQHDGLREGNQTAELILARQRRAR